MNLETFTIGALYAIAALIALWAMNKPSRNVRRNLI